MHSFRLRYIALGLLLIYIQSAFCRNCDTVFGDVPSRTVVAGAVFDGTVIQRHETFDKRGYFNVTFRVKTVYKGDLPRREGTNKYKTILVGQFGPENRQECIAELEAAPGFRYIVFLQGNPSSSLDPQVPFYTISGFPEPFSKTNRRLVRDYKCKKCAKPPKARVIPKEVSVREGQRVQVHCKTPGKPRPQVRWYKDGQLLQSTKHLKIKNSKRLSRLRIRKAKKADEGKYRCEVSNVVGTTHEDVSVVITVEPKVHPGHSQRCPEGDAFCQNGGRCFIIKLLSTEERFCKCHKDYTGKWCLEKVPPKIGGTSKRPRDAQEIDRALTVSGLVIALLVLIALFIAAYFMAKKNRENHRKKMEEKKKLKNSGPKGNGVNLPPSQDGRCALDILDGPVHLPRVKTMEMWVQTEPFLLQPLMNQYREANGHPKPTCPHNGLHRQHTAPERLQGDTPPRPRLNAISATPDFEECRRRPNNVTVVNAVVETDPEQRSSPSQSSKTESAHANLDSEAGGTSVKKYKEDSDGGSHEGDSLEIDQRSDYDNQPPSDMEVNLESEADVQGLDASGDEVEGQGHCLSEHSCDSSDSEIDSSSSAGEEQALFQKLCVKPRVAQGDSPKMPTKPSVPSGHDAAGDRSWDNFDNRSPSAYAALKELKYAYTPFGPLDNDIITNRYSHEDAPNHKGGEELEECYPYDPDPDATVV